MTEPDPYEIVFTPTARRGMNRLPLSAATAMFEHLTGPVAHNPQRLGKQPERHRVSIVAVAHRHDAYRTP